MSSHQFPPSYLYDDSSLSYDEIHFGDFEQPRRSIGGGGGRVASIPYSRKKYVPPAAPNPLLDITIKVCLKSVNEKESPDGSLCSQIHWMKETKPVRVDANLTDKKTTKSFVYSSLISSSKPEREVTTKLSSVEPVSKKLSVRTISVSSPNPIIKVSPIKTAIKENKLSIIQTTSSTKDDEVVVYLKKSIEIKTPQDK